MWVTQKGRVACLSLCKDRRVSFNVQLDVHRYTIRRFLFCTPRQMFIRRSCRKRQLGIVHNVGMVLPENYATARKKTSTQIESLARETRTLKRLGLYERSLQQKAEKERKIEALKRKSLEEFTFTPKTTTSYSSHRTVTTQGSSGGGESVFDRLYRDAEARSASSNSWSTPTWSTPTSTGTSVASIPQHLRKSSSSSKSSSTDLGLSIPSHTNNSGSGAETASRTIMSRRFESRYQQHIQKMRERPVNDEDEKKLRDRRHEEQEMAECTFRPKIHWGHTRTRRTSKLIMEPKLNRKKISKATRNSPVVKGENRGPPLPNEIVVFFPTAGVVRSPPVLVRQPWGSPPRQPWRQRQPEQPVDTVVISPLREPSVEESNATSDLKTEYGSI